MTPVSQVLKQASLSLVVPTKAHVVLTTVTVHLAEMRMPASSTREVVFTVRLLMKASAMLLVFVVGMDLIANKQYQI